MKKVLTSLSIASAFLLAFAVSSFAQSSASHEDWTKKGIQVGGTIQMQGGLDYVPSESRDKARVSLFEKGARINVYGTVDEGPAKDTKYKMSLMLGGEEVPASNNIHALRDAWVDVPLFGDSLRLKIGQFFTPYSREAMSNQSDLMFPKVSINSLGFIIGMDQGLSFHGNLSGLQYAVGIFMGSGINTPERFLGTQLGVPMLMLRVGYSTLEKTIYDVREFDPNFKGTGFAINLNAMYTKDSASGHTSTMKSKAGIPGYFLETTGKSLMFNTNFNSALASSDQIYNPAQMFQVGVDAALQTEISSGVIFNASAEFNMSYSWTTQQGNAVTLLGGVAKVGIYMAPLQIGMRFAILLPDSMMGKLYTGSTVTASYPAWMVARKGTVYGLGTTPIIEFGPAVNLYLAKNVKILMEFKIWVDVPMYNDLNVGSNNIMVMPDVFSTAAGSQQFLAPPLYRLSTWDARMQFQFAF